MPGTAVPASRSGCPRSVWPAPPVISGAPRWSRDQPGCAGQLADSFCLVRLSFGALESSRTKLPLPDVATFSKAMAFHGDSFREWSACRLSDKRATARARPFRLFRWPVLRLVTVCASRYPDVLGKQTRNIVPSRLSRGDVDPASMELGDVWTMYRPRPTLRSTARPCPRPPAASAGTAGEPARRRSADRSCERQSRRPQHLHERAPSPTRSPALYLRTRCSPGLKMTWKRRSANPYAVLDAGGLCDLKWGIAGWGGQTKISSMASRATSPQVDGARV